MKLIYCTSIAFSDKLAHLVQIRAMAREFQKKLAEDFWLGVNYKNQEEEDIKIVCFNTNKSYLLAWRYLRFIKENKIDYVYCREGRLLFFINFYNKLFFRLKLKFIYEIHSILKRSILDSLIDRKLSQCSDFLIFITKNLKDSYLKNYPSSSNFLVSPDGVDLERFDIPISQQQARQKLSLPLDKKIIVYTGSFYFYDWKGVDIMLEAAKYFSDEYLFILVGGRETEIKQIQNKYSLSNVLLIPRQPQSEIPFYLKAADVLILPNKKGDIMSEEYTSPLKMFEYMASQRPIVASDLPSIREILNENSALLVEPNNPEALAQGIKKLLTDKTLIQRLSQQAFLDVKSYTWKRRVEEIFGFILK